MKPFDTLEEARLFAEDGHWIMTLPITNKNPKWCSMTEQERMMPCYLHWTTWERKEGPRQPLAPRWWTSPAPEFTFAGFTFPKYVFTLPKGSFEERVKRARNPVTGPYSHAPKPNQGGAFFYLESDFMPGMRWKWCDDIATRSIRHTGWFTDDYQDQKIRGLVFRLPRGRGFLAGWSMGERMASEIDTSYVYDDEVSAALAADSIAERAAEAEREYQEQQEEEDEND